MATRTAIVATLVALSTVLLASTKASKDRAAFGHDYHDNTYLGDLLSRWRHKTNLEDACALPTSSVPIVASPTQKNEAAETIDGTVLPSEQASLADYGKTVVAHHNAHRDNHSAPALSWDADLAATAERIARSCVYAHDTTIDGGGYGQNIAAGVPSSNISSVITELFYNSEVENFSRLYGQATPININDGAAFNSWGHFTQIVWKSTAKVGCATYDCSGSGLANAGDNVPPYFTVCNYVPAGNFVGEFASNVGQPLGYPPLLSPGK